MGLWVNTTYQRYVLIAVLADISFEKMDDLSEVLSYARIKM